MDLPLFGLWLSIHKDTLQYLDIGYLSGEGRGVLFPACDFPRLKVLILSRWQTGIELSPFEAETLLSPSLETFGWTFTIYDQHSEGWGDFGDKEERWIRTLAKAAITKKAVLNKIKIQFSPDEWGTDENSEYPWDRMDKICHYILPFSMTLEYNPPPLTKEGFLQWIKPKAISETSSPTCGEPERGDPQHDSDGSENNGSEDPCDSKDIREYFSKV
jgi:hypothetical protein